MKGWNQSLYKVVACATLLLGLASCSGGDGGGGGGTPPAASPTTGTFVDSLVDGLHFTSPPSNPAGGFTSGGGHFQCQSGDNVTFDLGGKVIGNPQPCSSNVVTAVSVFAATDITDPKVVNLSKLLLTLGPIVKDVIQIPQPLPAGFNGSLVPAFDDQNFDADVQAALPNGTGLVSEAMATTHLAASFKTLSVMIVNGGTVTSNPAGISCTVGTCSYAFVTDTAVTLTATGTGFTGWSVHGCAGTGTCVVTMNTDAAVTATFTGVPPPGTLTISIVGTGTGNVICNANGVAFGACATSYPNGTPLVLQGVADSGSTFAGWSSGSGSIGCTGTSNCAVTLTANSSVTATFTLSTTNFSVNASIATAPGNGGGGTVLCSAGGGTPAQCGSFAVGTQVTVTATPDAKSIFSGWNGGTQNAVGCNGTRGPCVIKSLTADSNITANFNRPILTVQVSGTGSVNSNPPGINSCLTSCTAPFDKGSVVTLTATGTGFSGWIGGGCPGTGSCVVPVNSDSTVTATFTPTVIVSTGLFTYHNDNARTGQNLNETILTWANVNQAQFGKKFSYPLDGIAYASPLYVANVSIPGQGVHNVVYVATEHDSVYAFDANGLSPTPLWQVSFINPAAGITTVPAADTGACCDIAPEIGITGTPVIDPTSGTLYEVAKTKEGPTTYVQRLHALNITTGAEKFSGPVVIQASVPGIGNGNDGNGNVPFNALRQNQRPALLLNNGVVYIGFASHGDQPPYHGWVLGYDAATLTQVMAYNDTANGDYGGIWQSGGGLAADAAGNIYFVTGNGTFDADSGGVDYGDSVEKISPGGSVLDFFTPHDQATLAALDLDLGSGSALLLPDQSGAHPHLLVTAGKNGTIYLIDQDNMGHFNPTNDNQIVQSLVNIFPNPAGSIGSGNFSVPVYFNGSVFFSPVGGTIQAFQLSNGLLSTAPTSQSAVAYSFPGGMFAISANGSTNGILWAVQRADQNPGVLHAYKATDLRSELYSSDLAPGSRDTLDIAAKFNIPLVANGKVYVASVSQLTIYGLLP